MKELQIVVFLLNREVYGADTEQVKQIITYQNVTAAPDMPGFTEGAVNLRGNVVPVVSLNKRFGYGESEITDKTRILVTEIDNSLIGFIVNDVKELHKAQPEDIEALPNLIRKAGNEYITRVAKKGDDIIAIINLEKVLTDSEISALKMK